jgi:hypothetical protein
MLASQEEDLVQITSCRCAGLGPSSPLVTISETVAAEGVTEQSHTKL